MYIWRFLEIWVPQNVCFIRETRIKINDLGVPPFVEPAISTYTHTHISLIGVCTPLLPFISLSEPVTRCLLIQWSNHERCELSTCWVIQLECTWKKKVQCKTGHSQIESDPPPFQANQLSQSSSGEKWQKMVDPQVLPWLLREMATHASEFTQQSHHL